MYSNEFSYQTSDGQTREETGTLVDGEQELVVRGSYSFTGPDNKVYLVQYVADRNGFKPHLTIVTPNVEEDPQNTPPAVSFGVQTETGIRSHALKSLLG